MLRMRSDDCHQENAADDDEHDDENDDENDEDDEHDDEHDDELLMLGMHNEDVNCWCR